METRGCFQLMPRESEPLGDAALSPRRNTTAPLKTGEIEAGGRGLGEEKKNQAAAVHSHLALTVNSNLNVSLLL